MADRHPELRDAVLLARRATMRVDLELVNQLAVMTWDDAVNSVVHAPPDEERAPRAEKSEQTIEWWAARLTGPGSGLHERMTFFWHTLLTTHRYASGDQVLLADQLNMLRANALGDFRTLLHAFATDGALINYLNADSSTAKKPNENLARELMELFSVGLGHYTEDDVRAAALAMTGWKVDRDGYQVTFDPERAYDGPVTFMGETKSWDVGSIVDRLCDHPATAARVSSLLWYHFIGTELDAGAAAELGTWWQGQDLEIKPLLVRLFTEEAFRVDHYARPRSGFEYFTALHHLAGFDVSQQWRMRHLGQALYEPPNVAGWPAGDRWLNADSMLRRSDLLFSFSFRELPGLAEATVEEVLDRCGLFVVSEATVDAVSNAGTEASNIGEGGLIELRWRVAASSPEFQLL